MKNILVNDCLKKWFLFFQQLKWHFLVIRLLVCPKERMHINQLSAPEEKA